MSFSLSSAFASPASRDAFVTKCLIWAGLALPSLWGLSQLFPPLNHDVGAVLQWSGRMLDGERLYVDIFDVNPPLIYWLNLIPAGLARLLGLSPPVLYVALVLLSVVGAAALARPLFLASVGPQSFAAAVLPAMALFVLLAYPQGSFGQREHLFVIFTLPYLLLAVARARGLPVGAARAVAIALLGAIGIAIKPYFALLPVLLELYLLALTGWRARLGDPVPWIIAGVGVVYLAAAWLIHPTFFTQELPLAAAHYEGGGGWRSLALPESLGVILALLPLAAASFLMPGARLPQVLALAVLAGLIGGCLQGRGWDYHFLPARSAVILLGWALGTALLDRWMTAIPNWPKAALGGCALIMALFLVGDLSPPFKNQIGFANTPGGRALAIIRPVAEGRSVLWLTTSIYPQFPVLNYTGSTLAMPNESLWLLPQLYETAPAPEGRIALRAPDAMSPEEAELFHGTAAMAARMKPALIITTDSWAEPGFRGREFDYLAYFGKEPRFAALFADYRPLAKLGAWTFYQRIPGR